MPIEVSGSEQVEEGCGREGRIAARLRAETAVPLKCVAKELKMDSVAYVAERLDSPLPGLFLRSNEKGMEFSD